MVGRKRTFLEMTSAGADKSSASQQKMVLREQARELFKQRAYEDCIELYKEAVSVWPDDPIFWCNLSLCYLKLEKWDLVEEHATKALGLDSRNLKARYALGVAILKSNDSSRTKEAEHHLREALTTARVQDGRMVKEVWFHLSSACDTIWKEASERRSAELDILMWDCIHALQQQACQEAEGPDVSVINGKLKAIERVFDIAKRSPITRDNAKGSPEKTVPNYLQCPISLQIVKDPVLAPSGITFEKESILKHIQNRRAAGLSLTDPVTLAPVDETQLVPNIALREAAEEFLAMNGWAYKD